MSCCYWRVSVTLHVDVLDDECGLLQGKVEVTIGDSNVQAKPEDAVLQFSTEDGLKTIPALPKSQNWKSEVSRDLLLLCFCNLGQVHLLLRAVEW